MDQTITIRDLIWPAVAILGVLGVVVLLNVLANIFSDTWKH